MFVKLKYIVRSRYYIIKCPYCAKQLCVFPSLLITSFGVLIPFKITKINDIILILIYCVLFWLSSWNFIGVLDVRTAYYSPVDTHVGVAYNSHRCFG